MVKHADYGSPVGNVYFEFWGFFSRTILLLISLCGLLVCLPAVKAQTQQPFVFTGAVIGSGTGTPGIAVLTRNDQTGALTPVNGSPFPSKENQVSLALDVKGRFLFSVGQAANNVSMFTIDSNTGAVQEVPTSPFAASTTDQPFFVATEITGQYVYVVNQAGPSGYASSIDVFQIDAANSQLVPFQNIPLLPQTVAAANDPRGHALYVYLGLNSQNNINSATIQGYSYNPASGWVEQSTAPAPQGNSARSLAVDPQGRFLVAGHGMYEGQMESYGISPTDGSLGPESPITILNGGQFPSELFLEGSGTFLYFTITNVVHIYSAATLQELASSPLPNFVSTAGWSADPTGPFVYVPVSGNGGIAGYQVDPQSGLLTQISGSPFALASATGPMVFSRPSGQQPSVGPVVLLNPSTLSFGSITLGQSSNTQLVNIVSNGDQALSITSITVSGANATDFPETDTCRAPTVLQPAKYCTASVTFTPGAAGNRQASLTVTDNAAGSPHSTLLTGLGVAPAPAVTLIPGALTFSTTSAPITQGTSSAPQSVTLTNSGAATLHLSGVSFGGANANDFSLNNGCSGAIPVNGTCTVSATFAPLAAGQRTATIAISDDAAGSPQTIALAGYANPAVTATTAPNGSTTATVTAGHSAQYQLQLMPGSGFTGSVSLACSGAPTGATCTVPQSVSVTNGNPAPFSVTVTTSGSGAMAPFSNLPRVTPFAGLRMLPMIAMILLIAWVSARRRFEPFLSARKLAWSGVLAALVFVALLGVASCGGTGNNSAPPLVTPQGIYTVTVTSTATAAGSQKALQLQPIQLTLTVK